jgi:hypothetical protein
VFVVADKLDSEHRDVEQHSAPTSRKDSIDYGRVHFSVKVADLFKEKVRQKLCQRIELTIHSYHTFTCPIIAVGRWDCRNMYHM